MSKYVIIKDFVEYIEGKNVSFMFREDMWKEFLACPKTIIPKIKKNNFTQHSFFYCLNIYCKNNGICVLKLNHRAYKAGRPDYKYIIHSNAEASVI